MALLFYVFFVILTLSMDYSAGGKHDMEKQLKKNDIIPLEISGMSHDGNGVGRFQDFVLFVPMTAPGDKILCHVVKVNHSFGYGRVMELLEPSPMRMENDCPAFRQCGGCSWRHIQYQEELRLKQQSVEQNLKKIALFSQPLQPILSCKEERYRNKAQYPIGKDEHGRVIVGFYARRSHRIIPCSDCKLQPEFFTVLCNVVKDWADRHQISVYNEKTGKGLLRHLYLRTAQKTGQTMVCVVATSEKLPHEEELCECLIQAEPSVRTVLINRNLENTNVILGKHNRILFGKGCIEDEICGVRIRISPQAFYQVNRDAAEKMYQLAAEYAQPKDTETLLDLYCGTGTIGLTMAKRVSRLIGVEVIGQAVEDAKDNARRNQIANAEFLCADAGKAAQHLANRGERPDIIVVDPPRKGCDDNTLDAIVKMSPQRLVYISCNSATLARDVAKLEQNGYHFVKGRPVDLFPRTTHVEAVVLLSR